MDERMHGRTVVRKACFFTSLFVGAAEADDNDEKDETAA
jgi:hypothetical protein